MRVVKTCTTMLIDTDLFTKQRALIGTLIGNLDNGRTGICIMRDRERLIGIQGILDAVADSVYDADSAKGSEKLDEIC